MAVYEPPNYRALYEQQQKETESWRNAAELFRETLRDQFAMAIAQGMLANSGDNPPSANDLAEYAYRYANAMLEARKAR